MTEVWIWILQQEVVAAVLTSEQCRVQLSGAGTTAVNTPCWRASDTHMPTALAPASLCLAADLRLACQ